MSAVHYLLFSLVCFTLSMVPVQANVQDYFNTIKTNPNALYAFFKEMPKGGELHYHLSGGAYPEKMVELAAQHGYCLNPHTQAISNKSPCQGIDAITLSTNQALYDKVIRAWSMKNFMPGQESAHDHFFASFFKFFPIEFDFRPQLLAEVMQRASNQHELYLEVMVLFDNAHSTTFASLIKNVGSFNQKRRLLLANALFQQTINQTIQASKRLHQQAQHELGCEARPHQAGCELTVKFQYIVLREQPLDQVFAQALHGFAAAHQSNDIVGINLVQAEDGLISLRDYHQQMKIFKFLQAIYPDVPIALHAGELSPSSVTPASLRFHIQDAIHTGHAKRIGHGVDIAYENRAEELLNYMAQTPILVEINLTSNQEILQIFGKKHPLCYYLEHNVPVVLSTDDEGILRTDLSREYVKAVLEHGLDYPTIKTIARNALTYSFLPGDSLWLGPKNTMRIQACQNLASTTCQQWIKNSEKARLQQQLEQKLMAFEMRFNTLE